MQYAAGHDLGLAYLQQHRNSKVAEENINEASSVGQMSLLHFTALSTEM